MNPQTEAERIAAQYADGTRTWGISPLWFADSLSSTRFFDALRRLLPRGFSIDRKPDTGNIVIVAL